MNIGDIKYSSKVLCEIIMKKDPELFEDIRDIQLSAISNRKVLSEKLMTCLKARLSEWDIDIQSFAFITSRENSLTTMNYLIETIQSDALYELEKLRNIKETLAKEIRSVDKILDCLEGIPELLLEFRNRVKMYNVNSVKRISIYKSLKDFASDLYGILATIKKKSNNFKGEKIELNLLEQYMLELLQCSIVVKDYPSRTIKKGTPSKVGTHFKITVDSLIEAENLYSSEKIEAYFLTEEDFREYINKKELKSDCKIKFVVNNSSNWELKNMLWSPPERLQKDRRKSERITNNKAIIVILFKASVNAPLFGPLKVESHLFSDTVVSIVHTNQEIDALITLFWDDYFRLDRSAFLKDGCFKCHDQVTISQFVDAVSLYFEKETSRGLTLSNKEFLSRKLFTTTNNGLMTLHKFGSQPLPESGITLGTWLLSIIKLLKISGTVDLWKGDLIEGFMRKDVESMFTDLSPGTFSLRFSEKNAKIGVLLKTPNNTLEAWNPFSADECRNRSLCERLMEFHELQLIRTANGTIVKKEEALARFITDKQLDDGYTERGQLSRILCSNIYSESLCPFDDSEDLMDTDPFLGDGYECESL